jgi:hypothetical protein
MRVRPRSVQRLVPEALLVRGESNDGFLIWGR